MRYLIIGFAEYPGSSAASNHIHRLSLGLIQNGNEVTVIGFGGRDSRKGCDGSGVKYINYAGPKSSIFSYLASISEFGRALSKSLATIFLEELPGHVIYHGRSFWIGEIIRRKCEEGRVPMTPYQVEWFGPSAQRILNCSYIDQALFRRITIRRCGRLIGISRFWKTWGQNRGITCEVIPALNPIIPRTERAVRSSHGLRIAFVGGLHKRELPRTLFRGISLAIKRNVELSITMVGRPPNNLKALIGDKDTALALGRTTFTGWVSQDQLWSILFNSDAGILLRDENRETQALFPTRLPEYMVAGVPIIASAAGDIPYYLDNGINSILIPPGNRPAELANAIERLAADPELVNALSKNATKTALERFEPFSNAKRLINFLESSLPKS
jgi:glycosyltransferase involved in cell wall biosynthesis